MREQGYAKLAKEKEEKMLKNVAYAGVREQSCR